MASIIRLGSRNTTQLNDMVVRALDDAARCMMDMTSKDVAFDSTVVRLAPVIDAPLLLGNPERMSIALRCGIRGGLSGSIHLVATLPDAQRLIEKLSGIPTGWIGTPDAHSSEVLVEYATVLSTFILNSVAAATGIQAVPTTPILSTGLRRDIVSIQSDGPDMLVSEVVPFVGGGVTHSLMLIQLDTGSLDLLMRWMWRNSAGERARALHASTTILGA